MKLPAIIWASVLVVSCKPSPEEKAQKTIIESLRLSLHDYKSYEPVQFGKLDSAYSKLEDLPMIIISLEAFNKADKEFKSELEEAKIYAASYYTYNQYSYHKRLANLALAQMTLNEPIIDSAKKGFRPEFVGWKMQHSYRAKNLSGNLGIHHYMYFLNKSLDSVFKQTDVSESAKQ